MKTVGIILIVAGILMMIFRGFYYTKKEKVVDIGVLEINKKERKAVDWPIYAGAIIIASGAIILVVASRKNR
jgi:uncharacterized membrane protein